MLQLYSKDMPWPIAFDSSFDNMSTRNKQGGKEMMVFINEDSWFIEVGDMSICNVNGWWVNIE